MDELETERRLTELETRVRALEPVVASINRLATGMEVMATKQDQVVQTVASLDRKVSDLEARPGKRYDGIVEKIIWACVAAVITFILSHIGF